MQIVIFKRKGIQSDLVPFSKSVSGPFEIELHKDLINSLIGFSTKSLSLYGLEREKDLKKRAIFYLNYFHELFSREKI